LNNEKNKDLDRCGFEVNVFDIWWENGIVDFKEGNPN